MSDRLAKLFVGVLGFRATGMLRLVISALVLAALGWLGVDRWNAWELAGERQTLETRAFELEARAMAPGSALACLDVVASSTFQDGCEKALFATAESTAAAVSFVAAQLSLLTARKDLMQRAGDGDDAASLARLRRNAEWDAFGLVAHVLAARDGCTADECPALAMLNSPQRVRANLARRAFDANVSRYAAVWANGSRTEVARVTERTDASSEVAAAPAATTPAATTPSAPARKPNNYFYPSADSIPAVSIMAPEPPVAAADKPKPVTAEANRKPAKASNGAVAHAAASSPAARDSSAPMPLAPPGR